MNILNTCEIYDAKSNIFNISECTCQGQLVLLLLKYFRRLLLVELDDSGDHTGEHHGFPSHHVFEENVSEILDLGRIFERVVSKFHQFPELRELPSLRR